MNPWLIAGIIVLLFIVIAVVIGLAAVLPDWQRYRRLRSM